MTLPAGLSAHSLAMDDTPSVRMTTPELRSEVARIERRLREVAFNARSRAFGYILQTSVMMGCAYAMLALGIPSLFVVCASLAVIGAFLGADEQRFALETEDFVKGHLRA